MTLLKRPRRRGGVLAVLLAAGLAGAGIAGADPGATLPVFTPGPTDWSPNFQIWPYSTFVDKVTPEMISGMSDSCQWFNAQFDPLMGQINDVHNRLADQHDSYAGLQGQADGVVATIDQSTAFLAPRMQPLTIRNNLDNYGPYSPIYGGEMMTSLTFQLSRISESMRRKDPSGVTYANIAHAAGWGNALRDSGACT